MGTWLIRLMMVIILGFCGLIIQPFHLSPGNSLIAGLMTGLAIVLGEIRVSTLSVKTLIGSALGSIGGIIGASLISQVISRMALEPVTAQFIQMSVLILMTYVGLVVGAQKGQFLDVSALEGLFLLDKSNSRRFHKILDTSVIIDGRIADILDTGFLEGVLVVPQFVLRELQQVADSTDSIKRNRGRRGLDILQRIQKKTSSTVDIIETDFPDIREVDLKLIELAKKIGGKIVTNDFNLNKVAQLRGVEVLNINELANTLKPVVLPGELMKVFILKEGKEPNQGIAYLDDGTMVVVDNARKMIGKNVAVAVTSVLQTTAGKMIFGRFDESALDPGDNERSDQRAVPERSFKAQGKTA